MSLLCSFSVCPLHIPLTYVFLPYVPRIIVWPLSICPLYVPPSYVCSPPISARIYFLSTSLLRMSFVYHSSICPSSICALYAIYIAFFGQPGGSDNINVQSSHHQGSPAQQEQLLREDVQMIGESGQTPQGVQSQIESAIQDHSLLVSVPRRTINSISSYNVIVWNTCRNLHTRPCRNIYDAGT